METNGMTVAQPTGLMIAGGAKEKISEKTLDAAVSEVRKLKVQTSESIWQLGVVIRDIHVRKLWAQRTEDDGKGGRKAKWKSFEAFCIHELGFTPQTAHALSDVSANYSSEDVKKFGTAKLNLVLQAPKADQPRIQEQVAKGATKKEIEKEVRKAKKESNFVREPRNAAPAGTSKAKVKAMKEGREKKAVEKKEAKTSQITVASIIGVQTLKLYKKPAARTFDLDELPRAKRLADRPFGVLDLVNGVEMHVLVDEDAAGNLVLKINTKRSET